MGYVATPIFEGPAGFIAASYLVSDYRYCVAIQSSVVVMVGMACEAASCRTIRAPTWRANS